MNRERGAGRFESDFSVAAMIGKAAQRPFEQVAARGASYQANAVELEQVGERQHVDVFVYGVEARDRADARLPEGPDP